MAATEFCLRIDDIQLAEFDLGGVLYHANYFRLYERIRERFLESIGIPYPSLVEEGSHLAVTETHQRFLKPIVYGQAFNSRLWITDTKIASFICNYEFSSADTSIHKAWTKHAFVGTTDGKVRPQPLPERLKNGLS